RVPGDLPQVPFRVPEIAAVTAPEGLLRRLDDRRAGSGRLGHHPVDLLAGAHVVGQAGVGRTRRIGCHAGIGREAASRPQGQAQARLQVEERDRAVLELLADDAFRRPSEAVPVEAYRPVEVVDTESDQGDVRLHGRAAGVR